VRSDDGNENFELVECPGGFTLRGTVHEMTPFFSLFARNFFELLLVEAMIRDTALEEK
jgi:hypothetical protein